MRECFKSLLGLAAAASGIGTVQRRFIFLHRFSGNGVRNDSTDIHENDLISRIYPVLISYRYAIRDSKRCVFFLLFLLLSMFLVRCRRSAVSRESTLPDISPEHAGCLPLINISDPGYCVHSLVAGSGVGSGKRSSLNRHFIRLALFTFPYNSAFPSSVISRFVQIFPWVKDKKDAAMRPARHGPRQFTRFPNRFPIFSFSLLFPIQPNHFLIRQS